MFSVEAFLFKVILIKKLNKEMNKKEKVLPVELMIIL